MAFRTKKISQMDPKGANLASTDLLEISELVSGSYVTKSITGQEIIDSVPPSTTAWGTITGTLSAQTDLNTALSGKVPTTRTLTINGTTQDLSANRTFTISTGITIGTTAITSGTVGRVLFEGTGNVVQESANLFWDNTNKRLGIGTSSPTFPLDVTYNDNSYNLGLSVRNTNAGTTALIGYSIYNSSNVKSASFVFAPANFAIASLANTVIFSSEGSQKLGFIANSGNGGTAQDIYFSTSGGNTTYQMQIKGNGNVQIGTNTDAGFKLDVNGTARVVGQITANANIVQTANASSITAGYEGGFVLTGGVGSLKRDTTGYLKTLLDCGYDGGLRIRPYSAGFTSYVDVRSDTSAALTVTSTNQGFLPPRLTTTQKNAIASPATGLMVYDTTLNLISVYNGTTWITL